MLLYINTSLQMKKIGSISIMQPAKTTPIVPDFKQTLKNLREMEKWNFFSKKYTKEYLQDVFLNINHSDKVRFIWLHWNQISSIINIIVVPVFSQLKVLNIGGNNIVSIEPIQHLQMPNIEQMWLWSNKITHINSLRKIYAPRLRVIDLSSNLIVSCGRIHEINCVLLQRINIQKNCFSNILDFMKIKANLDMKILLIDNDLIKIANLPYHKGKRIASAFINGRKKMDKIEYC